MIPISVAIVEMPHDDYVRMLETENRELRARIECLTRQLAAPRSIPERLALPAKHARIFSLLMVRDRVTKAELLNFLYPERLAQRANNVESHVSKLNARLGDIGVSIDCERNLGYALLPAMKAKLRAYAEGCE